MMATAARANEERGADIIDINLGCPAKKVLKKAAGSALMRDEVLCAEIFRQVVRAVKIPVTVKMRTGWDHRSKNGPMIAKMAEDLGLQAITMHGRTRCDMYKGNAEYDTIRRTREAVQIPLIANGDITSITKGSRSFICYWSRCSHDRPRNSRRPVATGNHRRSTRRSIVVSTARRRSNRYHGQTHPRDSIVLRRKNGRQNGT